ncbi:hypothetical protein J6590_028694 [Homalodisca vitripennis]|nr:hypothetical protein J6590_028694 [Homalodisca vitripennis]
MRLHPNNAHPDRLVDGKYEYLREIVKAPMMLLLHQQRPEPRMELRTYKNKLGILVCQTVIVNTSRSCTNSRKSCAQNLSPDGLKHWLSTYRKPPYLVSATYWSNQDTLYGCQT